MQKELILNGLNCAHCAGLIEDEVKNMGDIKEATLDFISKRLIISAHDEETLNKLLPHVISTVDKIEPGLDIVVKDDGRNNKNTIKKEIILNGLNCAHCAGLIEEEVKNMGDIKEAVLDFVNKRLIIYVKNEKILNEVLPNVINTIDKIEPGLDIVVKDDDRNNKNTIKKEIILNGLNCAHCAGLIEEEVKNMGDIKEAVLDFVSKRLIIYVENEKILNEVLSNVISTIDKIEPGLDIVIEKEKAKSENKKDNKKIIKFGSGIILFVIGLLFKFSFPVELILFLTSYLLVGGEVLIKAVKNIARGQVFDENFLMTIATIGAFCVKEFPEAVAVMIFYQVGEFFQGLAVNKSRKSIEDLMDIRPDFANLKIGDDIKRVSPEDVNIGDIIIVKPGEKIPLDGVIIEGSSMVDTSALTGESIPREVSVKDEVLGGFINTNGVLSIEVSKDFEESTVSKILDLVQNASIKKSNTENFITKFARYYTPIVVFLSLAIAIVPTIVIEGAVFSSWLYRALIFLVISCPCALVVSIPLSFFGGIGGASKNGILIKGSNYLEALNSVDTVVFDKTGTLTKGIFKVSNIVAHDISKDKLLEYAAFGECFSNHPIAISILKEYKKEIDKSKIKEYEEIPGYGVKIKIEDKEVLVGNAKLMKVENIQFEDVQDLGTIIYIAINKKYEGFIEIADEIKEDSLDAIKNLKAIGIKNTVMLTGDNKAVAENIGNKLNMDTIYSNLLPHEKVEKFEFIASNNADKGKILFVGDGINDAPVLARADIGVAMGGLGSDAAIEAADIVLMTDEISKLVSAIKIAKRTRVVVWQNIIFALGVKLIVLLLGAGGIATMWEAVFADVGVALIAVLNSMRVMNFKMK